VTDSSLSVLLSQVLVAFAIEFDNEFELQMSKTYARPFKTSIVMWSNFMRYVRDEPTTVEEIAQRSCAKVKDVASVVGGMERWGYIAVDHDPATGVPPIRKGFGSASGVKRTTVIRPSMVGALAIERWTPLAATIEQRWRARLGDAEVDALIDALRDIDARSDEPLPRFLPIVGGLMFADVVRDGTKEPDEELPALLSRVLLAFTLETENAAPVSLPLGENVLRVLDDGWTAVKDLPSRTGVSKEAVAMSLTSLRNLGQIEVGPAPDGRGKAARITPGGEDARRELAKRKHATEMGFQERFGKQTIADLRSALVAILDRPGGEDGALSSGLVTPPGGWRAEKRYKASTDAFVTSPRAGLPHYPMVLHRGGWPDGS
jgi:DNA-binding MarR family transcriptional regulator